MDNLIVNRRQFIGGTIATGYALAVSPAAASAIHTDSDGLEVGPVSIPVSDGHIPGYMARPRGDGKFPVILVVHEVFDLHEYIQDVCRRFAKQGYLAIAPSLFHRAGDATKTSDINKIITDIAAKTPDHQVMLDLLNTGIYAMANHGDDARIGVTGFCWGGRIAWLFAGFDPNENSKFGFINWFPPRAAVAWYGMVGQNPFGGPPVLDSVAKIDIPVLGLYGGKDTSIPLDTLDQMKTALKANGKTGEIIVYPDAGHGFFADYRPSYDADASSKAWKECLDWFGKYLT